MASKANHQWLPFIDKTKIELGKGARIFVKGGVYISQHHIFEESQIMTGSDLKLKIFRQIDSLERNRLEELYGVLLIFLNEKRDISDWERLTPNNIGFIFKTI